jgi:L-xylulokinase
MGEYLLGIDNGLTLSKAALFDLSGHEVKVASRKIEVQYPKPGYTERDMDTVWQTTAEAIREVIETSRIKPSEILAIGNSGHGNGLYMLDHDNRVFHPSIASMDGRAGDLVAEWNQPGGVHDQAFPYTLQGCWAAQPSVLLAWLKRYEPESYDRIGKVMLCTDFLKFCLTGEHTTDFSIISGSSLLESANRAYSRELMEIFGIPEMFTALPRPVWGHEIAGRVTPVAGGLFDIDAAALGSGVISDGVLSLVAGTWSINQVITTRPIVDRQIFLTSLFAVPGMWLTLEASATSATNLEWFVSNFCAEEKAEAKARGISVYEVCNERVASLPPGSVDIIFHPYLFGSDVQATARAGFYGLGAWHTKTHVLRALYEGVVYGHMHHIATLRAAGAQMTVARMTGGGSHSHVWTQMFADALQLPIEVSDGAEVAARGVAMAAGISAGVYRDHSDAVAQTVRLERRHEPNPDTAAAYQARYAEYVNLLEAMKEPWNRLARLSA